MTWWPFASITFVDLSPSRSTPRAVIFSPVTPTSPVKIPAGVTTLPPLMILSNGKDPLLFCCIVAAFPRDVGDDAFLTGNAGQCAIEHIEREVRVFGGDAHRRF